MNENLDDRIENFAFRFENAVNEFESDEVDLSVFNLGFLAEHAVDRVFLKHRPLIYMFAEKPKKGASFYKAI